MLIVSPWTYNRNVLNVMLSTLEKPVAPLPTIWMDTGSLPRHRTQTYQLLTTLHPARSFSKNAGLSVSYTNYLTPPQTTSAANLKLHTNLSSNPNTFPVSTSIKPPNSSLAPAVLKVLIQSALFYCWGRPLCLGRNIHFCFVFISICLSGVHPRAQRRSRQSKVSAALSSFHIYLFVSCLSRFSLLYTTSRDLAIVVWGLDISIDHCYDC